MKFIFKAEKKRLIKKLEYYGIKKLPYLLAISKANRIRGYSGDLSAEELIKFNREIGSENAGLYLFHEHENEIMISSSAVNLLKSQITKNIIEINKNQAEDFFKGQDILLNKEDKLKLKKEPRGFKVLKYKGELIGVGKLTEERIITYMQKERQV